MNSRQGAKSRLDPPCLSAYCLHMDTPETCVDIRAQIKALDTHLDTLIKRAGQIRRHAEKIATERARARVAQERARTRIEAMIGRLKSLEHNT